MSGVEIGKVGRKMTGRGQGRRFPQLPLPLRLSLDSPFFALVSPSPGLSNYPFQFLIDSNDIQSMISFVSDSPERAIAVVK